MQKIFTDINMFISVGDLSSFTVSTGALNVCMQNSGITAYAI